MSWNGKWKMTSVENAEAYYTAIHSPEAYKEQLKQLAAAVQQNPEAYIEELTVDSAAGNFRRIVYILGEKNRDTGLLSFDTEYEHLHADGRVIKTKTVLESPNKIVVHEKGEDFQSVITIELNGDEMIARDTSSGVTSTEKFARMK